jgi:hypothetical protein
MVVMVVSVQAEVGEVQEPLAEEEVEAETGWL